MEYSAFEEATVPICTFVLQNMRSEEKGNYIKLSDFRGGMEVQRVKTLEAIQDPECGHYYETNQHNFEKVPGMPIAYWASEKIFMIFSNGTRLEEIAYIVTGISTGNNDNYLRNWPEVTHNSIALYKKIWMKLI